MDWKAIVKTVAPALGTALGGPLGGMATKLIAEKFLGNPNATDDEIAQAIGVATPQDLFKLKELDNNFKLEVIQLSNEVIKIDADDRASARSREKDMAVAGQRDWTTPILAYVNTVGFYLVSAIILYIVKTDSIDPTEATVIGMILGYCVSEAKQISSYYFGSSSGSRSKDDTIGKLS